MIDESFPTGVTGIVGVDNIHAEDGELDSYFRGGANDSGPVLVRPGFSEGIQDLVVLSGV